MQSPNIQQQILQIITEIKQLSEQQAKIQEQQQQLIAALERVVNESSTNIHTPAEPEETYIPSQGADHNGYSGVISTNTKEEKKGNTNQHRYYTPSGKSHNVKQTTPTIQDKQQIKRDEIKERKQSQEFKVGQHIYIKNKITHSDRKPTIQDRAAVITHIDCHQINFRTYTGVETWRSLYNIRILTPQEQQQFQHDTINHHE